MSLPSATEPPSLKRQENVEPTCPAVREAAAGAPASPSDRTGRAGHGSGPKGTLLVGGRPASRPRRLGRAASVAVAGVCVAAAFVLGLRYLVPHPAKGEVVHPGTLVVDRRGPGTLDAIDKSTVGATIQGRIAGIGVDRGDKVAKGDVVAELEAGDLKNQLAVSKAAAAAASAAVEKARVDRQRRRATLDNARQTHARQASLRQTGSTTQANLDAARASLHEAEADLAAAGAAIDQAEAQQQSAEATVAVDEARLAQTVIRAPMDGIVISRDRNVGDIVTPGSSIMQIVDPSTIILTARFDESVISSVEAGQEADVSFASEGDRVIAGKVLRIGREVDTETREFTADVVPTELPPNWAIGQRGTATITVAVKTDVIAVATEDIVRRDGAAGLWVVEEGRASWRPVTLGQIGGGRVEIEHGLFDGDVVLAPGRVFDWMRVREAEIRP
ncbi:efflux RND transporter periplasmic adaptor subunit [Jiella sonneratiae]|uniref:Efflux RND transporter periplasmic adaptor subunit n=1 Tax=Jiella sonneratiae TaxID=2816856 RepID=A0ABS3J8T2_9HYPH|nr:efflux RND transporter periplasmic adaptor subunit [Jiella sonneratiae]MBO0906074.1 efflux RND transporter periplasmic adaptor subunit [Jiella sonneratiae]